MISYQKKSRTVILISQGGTALSFATEHLAACANFTAHLQSKRLQGLDPLGVRVGEQTTPLLWKSVTRQTGWLKKGSNPNN